MSFHSQVTSFFGTPSPVRNGLSSKRITGTVGAVEHAHSRFGSQSECASLPTSCQSQSLYIICSRLFLVIQWTCSKSGSRHPIGRTVTMRRKTDGENGCWRK